MSSAPKAQSEQETMANSPYPDAKIVIRGTLSPDPLSRLLPVGTPVRLHLEVTLQNAESPYTLPLVESILDSRQFVMCRFASRNIRTGEVVPALRLCCALKASGPRLNAETDLLTLYPNVTRSIVLTENVYAYRGQPHVFGTRLNNLEPGEKYCSERGGALWSMYWFYWGSREEAVNSIPQGAWDKSHQYFTAEMVSIFDIPLVDMAVEYTASE